MLLIQQAKELSIRAGTTVIGWIVSLLVTAVVLIVGNVVVVGGQYLWHQKDYAKLDAIKQEMASQKIALSAQESDLSTKGAEIDQQKQELERKKTELTNLKQEMAALRTSLDQTERSNPNGIPSASFPEYRSTVDQYNQLVRTTNQLVESYNTERDKFNSYVDAYNAEHSNYSKSIDAYNGRVTEANAVSKTIGGTIVLVPGIGRRSRISSGVHE